MALTKEQLLARKNGLGGSDIAALLGIGFKGKGPLDLYHEKINPEIEFETNYRLETGAFMEAFLVKKYEEMTQKQVQQVDTKYHEEYSFLFANIDGLIDDGGILEAKTVGYHAQSKWGIENTFQIPDNYKCQVALYASIWNAPYVDIIADFHYTKANIYRYERNKKLEDNIILVAKNFWLNHVQKRIPPEAKSIGESVRYLKSLETEENSFKVISEDISETLKAYKSLLIRQKTLEEEIENHKNSICKYLEDKAYLMDEEGNCLASFKSSTRKSFDNKSFKESHSDLASQFIKTTNTRTFLLKDKL